MSVALKPVASVLFPEAGRSFARSSASSTRHDAYLGYVPPLYLRTTAELAAEVKSASYERMRVGYDHRVLDLGCGVGTDAIALARKVGPSGRAIGLDADPAMIEQARQAALAAGVNVRFDVADATALPVPDQYLDAARSERMFQHVESPERVAAELKRVLRGGGRLVVVDTDWASLSIATRESAIERRLVQFKAERTLRSGYVARDLRRILGETGFRDVLVETFPIQSTERGITRYALDLDTVTATAIEQGALSADEIARFEADQQAAQSAGRYFATVNMVVVSARSPA